MLAAGRSDTTKVQAALERLCQTYWYPLYAYVRRRVFGIGRSASNSVGLASGLYSLSSQPAFERAFGVGRLSRHVVMVLAMTNRLRAGASNADCPLSLWMV